MLPGASHIGAFLCFSADGAPSRIDSPNSGDGSLQYRPLESDSQSRRAAVRRCRNAARGSLETSIMRRDVASLTGPQEQATYTGVLATPVAERRYSVLRTGPGKRRLQTTVSQRGLKSNRSHIFPKGAVAKQVYHQRLGTDIRWNLSRTPEYSGTVAIACTFSHWQCCKRRPRWTDGNATPVFFFPAGGCWCSKRVERWRHLIQLQQRVLPQSHTGKPHMRLDRSDNTGPLGRALRLQRRPNGCYKPQYVSD